MNPNPDLPTAEPQPQQPEPQQPKPSPGKGLERASSLEREQPAPRDVDPQAEDASDPSKD